MDADLARSIDAVDGRDLRLQWDSGQVFGCVEPAAVARGWRAQRLGIYTVVHSGPELLHFNNHLTEGGIACAMSHQKTLRAVASHPTADWALILEDDIADVVPRFDEVLARVLRQLPEDWDAVLLGYHDSHGRVAGGVGGGVPDVPVRPTLWHDYGLFAYVVRKSAAALLLRHAFPVNGQVDKAVTGWLARERGRTFKVDPQSMLLISPKSEESQDSDVQTLGSIDQLVEQHGDVAAYNERMIAERALFEGY
ncbi:unnamed protein product [Prorocentrum cordatum]|uniref:Glycosyl transferase family 25 domain-containing protein n=1 Tax=Prorocentrum cordatum TaxID=2364126 RepID=A0ABN9WU64_9DINO|nr:unnamed protein product [Polarella glacialis]